VMFGESVATFGKPGDDCGGDEEGEMEAGAGAGGDRGDAPCLTTCSSCGGTMFHRHSVPLLPPVTM
jgi:hypothetical protein